MKLTLQFTYRGAPVEVTTTPFDVVAFERAYGLGFGKAFAAVDALRMEHQLWLAWHAHKRSGGTQEEFEGWMLGLDEFGQPEAEAPAPLDETPSTG